MEKDHDFASLAQEIDSHLAAIRQIVRKPVETEFARGGLTGPQRNVMQAVVHSNGINLKDLSLRVGLAHSTVSGIVDRLEKRGLLVRKNTAADRRFVTIEPSQVVRDYLTNELPSIAISPLIQALRAASVEERERVLDGVRTLRALLDR